MIEHVYHRATESRSVDAVVVATDDVRIADAVRRFGGTVRMTSPSHRTGTDRIAEVARDLTSEIVVCVQGDEPLINPAVIDELVAPLQADASLQMSTVCTAITDPADYRDPNVVKVVKGQNGDALYFSRAPIPSAAPGGPPKGGPHDFENAGATQTVGAAHDFENVRASHNLENVGATHNLENVGATHNLENVGATFRWPGPVPVFKHLGLYAYRREFLLAFAALPQTPLELAESLEQLRALEHGVRIRTVETQYDSLGVDTPEDLERARLRLQAARAGEVA
jgi:3-deoxy-manno-octulosonate cytidylyltransferase (CMP-KDO synthetase)